MMYTPANPHVVFIEPYQTSGTTYGIYVEFSDDSPKVCGVVVSRHPECVGVRVGDIAFFREGKPEIVKARDRTYHCIYIHNIYMLIRQDEQTATPLPGKAAK